MSVLAAALIAIASEHVMNEPLIAALDRALAGDAQVLQGLGIEEQVVASPSWDDRVSVDGAGAVTFASRRPAADRGGAPIGLFRAKLDTAELQELIRQMRQVVAAPPQPIRGEPYEARVLLSVVASGHSFNFATKSFPPALERIQPALTQFNKARMRAIAHPVRSLLLALEMPASVERGGAVEPVLKLRNGGEEGFWISNPAALANEPGRERAELVYARPLVFTPGVTPVPVPPKRTPLSPRAAAADEPPYRWIPPKGQLAVPMRAQIDVGDAKELVFRAELYVDSGEDEIAGQPRIRGSVFAADVKIPVSVGR